jgi:hypothetical protein
VTNWLAGMRITADRLNDDTPTTTSSGATAAANFTLNSFSGYKVGNTVTVNAQLQYTGADITATSGNITDTTAVTFPSGYRPTFTTVLGQWASSTESGACTISTGGACVLTSATGTIESGNTIRIYATFILD